jgi:hypothetical protein
MAMEYYGLRHAGADIDFVIVADDYSALAERYPEHTKDLFGDKGVCVHGFELWTSIYLLDYDDLTPDSVDKGDYRIVSLEKLLFLKALGMKEEKHLNDLRLIVAKVLDIQYGKESLPD